MSNRASPTIQMSGHNLMKSQSPNNVTNNTAASAKAEQDIREGVRILAERIATAAEMRNLAPSATLPITHRGPFAVD